MNNMEAKNRHRVHLKSINIQSDIYYPAYSMTICKVIQKFKRFFGFFFLLFAVLYLTDFPSDMLDLQGPSLNQSQADRV